jgi:RNA polymerase sigma-70 factor (ECF subfamily)
MHSSPHISITLTDFLFVFEATKDRLYGLFVKQTRDKHIAEDLLQDCYMRAWEKRNTLTTDNAEKYITGIAYHILADWHRVQVKKKLVYMEELPTEAPDMVTPGELFSLKETKHIIEQTLAGLSSGKKISFRLIKEEEKSYKEVAATLNTSVSTLEKQVASSLTALKKALKTHLLSWLG